MYCDECRYDKEWYIKINWRMWYSDKYTQLTKKMRRSDILLSALFKAASGHAVKIDTLVGIIGRPEWILGRINNGFLYYEMYSRSNYEYRNFYMMITVKNSVIQRECGTNKLLNFFGSRLMKIQALR